MVFEADPANTIVVPDDLRSMHPLVRATQDYFKSGTEQGSHRGSPRPQYLDIDVSKELLRRALRIMNALVRAFEARGWEVTLGTGDDRKSYVTILSQRLPFGIRETIKKTLNPPAKPPRTYDGSVYTPWQSKYHDEPSGRLAFVTRHTWGHGVDKSWLETTTRPLEQRLGDFIMSLVGEANEGVEADKRHEEAERVRREAEERRLAEARRREAEAARVRALERQSVRWETSGRLRNYLTAVRVAAQSQPGGIDAGSRLSDWLVWAEAYARSLDPLQQPLDNLLTVPASSRESDD